MADGQSRRKALVRLAFLVYEIRILKILFLGSLRSRTTKNDVWALLNFKLTTKRTLYSKALFDGMTFLDEGPKIN
jgi:hypothetical protein